MSFLGPFGDQNNIFTQEYTHTVTLADAVLCCAALRLCKRDGYATVFVSNVLCRSPPVSQHVPSRHITLHHLDHHDKLMA